MSRKKSSTVANSQQWIWTPCASPWWRPSCWVMWWWSGRGWSTSTSTSSSAVLASSPGACKGVVDRLPDLPHHHDYVGDDDNEGNTTDDEDEVNTIYDDDDDDEASLLVPSWQYSLVFFSAPDAQEVMCVCGGDGDGDDGDEPNVHLPRDLSEHIPLIVTTNILLQRFSVVVTINIWILHQIFIVTTFICCNKYCYN